jgi:hypothetical protein
VIYRYTKVYYGTFHTYPLCNGKSLFLTPKYIGLVVYLEVGSVPEELLQGKGRILFYIVYFYGVGKMVYMLYWPNKFTYEYHTLCIDHAEYVSTLTGYRLLVR